MRRGIMLGACMAAAAITVVGGHCPPEITGRTKAGKDNHPRVPPTEPLVETRQVRRARERREAKGAGR